jgi:hypothetical protein
LPAIDFHHGSVLTAHWDKARCGTSGKKSLVLLRGGLSLHMMPRRSPYRGGNRVVEEYHIGFARGEELVTHLRWRRLPVNAAIRIGLLTRDRQEVMAGQIT